MLDGEFPVVPQGLSSCDDRLVGHQDRADVFALRGEQGHLRRPSSAKRIGGHRRNRDIHHLTGFECRVQRTTVLRLDCDGTNAVLRRRGRNSREEATATHRDDDRVQIRYLSPDLVEKGARSRRDQGVVVGMAGQCSCRCGVLLAGRESLGVFRSDEPDIGAVTSELADLHLRCSRRQEHRRRDAPGLGRPRACKPSVAAGSNRHSRRWQTALLDVGGDEVLSTTRLEAAGELKVLKGKPPIRNIERSNDHGPYSSLNALGRTQDLVVGQQLALALRVAPRSHMRTLTRQCQTVGTLWLTTGDEAGAAVDVESAVAVDHFLDMIKGCLHDLLD